MRVSSQPGVLVTGSAGHLGAALMLSLPAHGYRPIGVDLVPSHTTNHVASVADGARMAAILRRHPEIQHIVHTAALHRPHLHTHSSEEFRHVNVMGTHALLVACRSHRLVRHRIKSFVYVSTTAAFGGVSARGRPGEPAGWLASEHIAGAAATTHENAYEHTKCYAEDLCHEFSLRDDIPVVVLRAGRFFPADGGDDDKVAGQANLGLPELAFRRVDVEDVVSACVCAMKKAQTIKWDRYVVSAPTVFGPRDEETLRALNSGAEGAVAEAFERAVPGCRAVLEARGWKFPRRVECVYDPARTCRDLGWEPRWTFAEAVRRIAAGEDWRSELTKTVGRKGHHAGGTSEHAVYGLVDETGVEGDERDEKEGEEGETKVKAEEVTWAW